MKKYNIDLLAEKMAIRTGGKKHAILRDIALALGMSIRGLHLLRSTTIGEVKACSSDQLLIMSEILECSVDDILNKQASEVAA